MENGTNHFGAKVQAFQIFLKMFPCNTPLTYLNVKEFLKAKLLESSYSIIFWHVAEVQ